MKNFFTALGITVLASATAWANHPGQPAQNLRQEIRELQHLVRVAPVHFQARRAVQRLAFSADNLTQCLGNGPWEMETLDQRPGRPGRPGGPGRPGPGGPGTPIGPGAPVPPFMACQGPMMETEMALNNVEHLLAYSGPRIRMQLSQVRGALMALKTGGNSFGVRVRGQMNHVPFAFQAPRPRGIVIQCLQFANANHIYRVFTLVVNGRPVQLFNGSPQESCQTIASLAN